ncbi:hypothetical protein D3C80_2136530 [compost metagenome]
MPHQGIGLFAVHKNFKGFHFVELEQGFAESIQQKSFSGGSKPVLVRKLQIDGQLAGSELGGQKAGFGA